eukprot:gene17923-24316_t
MTQTRTALKNWESACHSMTFKIKQLQSDLLVLLAVSATQDQLMSHMKVLGGAMDECDTHIRKTEEGVQVLIPLSVELLQGGKAVGSEPSGHASTKQETVAALGEDIEQQWRRIGRKSGLLWATVLARRLHILKPRLSIPRETNALYQIKKYGGQ